eukprot:CAMPEP_0117441702 /NCGR_PEP_ID=MMETSP0759-20121206/3769_1 /TAXON_ID=63605 /ORGANISM="Percolomonas cosmopolitus, Strain WS" /LENGTH=394 /DNA_ID=CAMNT_0005233561 /DNA_START=50 /DNA_END=1234 /DNA_ORIENTATION=+
MSSIIETPIILTIAGLNAGSPHKGQGNFVESLAKPLSNLTHADIIILQEVRDLGFVSRHPIHPVSKALNPFRIHWEHHAPKKGKEIAVLLKKDVFPSSRLVDLYPLVTQPQHERMVVVIAEHISGHKMCMVSFHAPRNNRPSRGEYPQRDHLTRIHEIITRSTAYPKALSEALQDVSCVIVCGDMNTPCIYKTQGVRKDRKNQKNPLTKVCDYALNDLTADTTRAGHAIDIQLGVAIGEDCSNFPLHVHKREILSLDDCTMSALDHFALITLVTLPQEVRPPLYKRIDPVEAEILDEVPQPHTSPYDCSSSSSDDEDFVFRGDNEEDEANRESEANSESEDNDSGDAPQLFPHVYVSGEYRQLFTGPRGGRYCLTPSGNKNYKVGHKVVYMMPL